MRESTFKPKLIEQLGLDASRRVLDLGCGTGTLTLLLKQACPEAEVIGLDIDPKVLRAARNKAEKKGMNIPFHQGMSDELPYPDRSFDRVVASLMFHHLTYENKRRTLHEVFRILKPQGELHIADWGKAQNGLMRLAFLSIQFLDGFKTTADHVKGILPQLIKDSGFVDVEETDRFMTLYGTLSLYRANKPANGQ